jgi:hypothetical protein
MDHRSKFSATFDFRFSVRVFGFYSARRLKSSKLKNSGDRTPCFRIEFIRALLKML